MGVTIRAYGIINGSLSFDMIKQIMSNAEKAHIKVLRLSAFPHDLEVDNPSIDIIWKALHLPEENPNFYIVCYHVKMKLEFSFFFGQKASEQNWLVITSCYPRALRKFRTDTEIDIGFYVQVILDLSRGLSLRDLDTAYY